jgi:bifunctional lysine-specific demethylase and histidyl-hydroxylase NO66
VTVGALDRTSSRGPLERCTGDADDFLRETWGRRANVRTNAEPGGFDDLLSLDDVDRFLMTTAIRTPFFRLVKAGEQIPESAYTRSGRTGPRNVDGMADPARVAALFENGATLVLQGLHRWSEQVTRFCRDLELELGHQCQANAYITPAGAQGLSLHEDPHDVFVLQAFGRKRWQVHAAPEEADRAPIEADIGPGDTIYMPAGTPHAASTQDAISGHLTVGVHVTPWRAVLDDIWSSLSTHPSAAGLLPAGWHRDPEGFARELSERLASRADIVRDTVDTEAIAHARAERFLSTRPQLARGAIERQGGTHDLGDTTALRRRVGSICELRLRDGVLVVMLGDRRLEMPAWLEPAMRRVAAADTLVLRELAPELPDPHSRAVLARRLVREGLLAVEDDG